MKKFLSVLLALVVMAAVAVPAFADSSADLIALINGTGGVTADQKAAAAAYVNDFVAAGGTVNAGTVSDLSAVIAEAKGKTAAEKTDGAVVIALANKASAALAKSGLKASFSVATSTNTVSVSGSVIPTDAAVKTAMGSTAALTAITTKSGAATSGVVSRSENATVPNITGGSSSNGVIKATGANANAAGAAVLALGFIAVLGMAAISARKLNLLAK